MTPDDPRHGTEAGHEQHYRDRETPCPPCYDAKLRAARRRTKRKTMGHKFTVPSDPAVARITMWRDIAGAHYGDIAHHVGIAEGRVWEIHNDGSPTIYTRTAHAILNAQGWPVTKRTITRRVRALTRLGWTVPKIAEACGAHHDTILNIRAREPDFVSVKVRDGVLAGYEALAMRLPNPTTQQERAGVTRARNYAEKHGWLAPMAFDDIDDPLELPGCEVHRPKTDVDEAVVLRVMAGERLPMTTAERVEVVARLRARGWSLNEIETHTGIGKAERYLDRGDAA